MTESKQELQKGYLFVFEGIDGAGKSVVIEDISHQLQDLGYPVVILNEPTRESPWGQEIGRRSPLGNLSPDEELDLFVKDREWHIANRIIPSLKQNKVILLDRYFFATGAYQSTSMDLDWREILEMNRTKLNPPEPDLVILLDISAEIGLRRISERAVRTNEQFEKMDRLREVRRAYLEMAREDVAPFLIVDASNSIDHVIQTVMNAILPKLEQINLLE